ncbi:NAD(P)H-binding protein [Streptomyces huiliensis]|uniref:NAD(P)H-binding protein n=1 Tax=Streptomyces huiliensis TaxID=2876027 RepID=UPI001CC1161D|nr:NAD(P)H-binding protein [Streptomyces huiliensis]MBZ4317817.1 NAD(P)H-binding protein [Streptomyces huiliensis]
MTTLVTGARGRVGRVLIDLLRSDGRPVRAGSNAPEELSLPTGTESVRCALGEPETFPAALDGVTSVFLYAQASHADAFLTEAERAGVEHIVLLSSTAALAPEDVRNPIVDMHRDAERALAAAPIASTALRPGGFATNALGWAQSIRTEGVVRLPYPEAHSTPIHERDIAEAAHAVLTADAHRGTGHRLSGPESLTFREHVEHIGRAVGRPLTVEAVGPEEWKRSVSAFMPEVYADTLLAAWRAADGVPEEVAPGVELLTGHPARTFAAWAEEHAAAFTA